MKNILTVAHNDIRLLLKNKAGYLWLFLVPGLFVYFFGLAFQIDDTPNAPNPKVLIENWDSGFLGELLLQELSGQGLTPIERGDGKADQGLRIPDDFTDKIMALEETHLELFQIEGGNTAAAQLLEARLVRVLVAFTSHLIEHGEPANLKQDALTRIMATKDLVKVDIRYAGTMPAPSGFGQSLPGMMVMFLMMNLIIYGGSSISDERRTGVIKRFATHPLNRYELVIGKVYGRFLLAAIQILFFYVLARFIFKIPLQGNLAALGLCLALYGWGCAALGVLLGGLVTNPDRVSGLGVLFGNLMGALGGCWWPMEFSPEILKTLSLGFPTGWAMRALHQLISFGGSWSNITLELFVLTGFAFASTLLAGKWLKW